MLFKTLIFLLIHNLRAFTTQNIRHSLDYTKILSSTALRIATTPFPYKEERNTSPELVDDLKKSELLNQETKLVLPQLSAVDLLLLSRGERIQKQSRNGRAGEGVVVVDVAADPFTVFHTLERFENYNIFMPTIRKANINRIGDKTARAEYSLSKFMLKVNVVHKVIPEQGLITFSLDETKPNMVMQRADGYWHTQVLPDRPDITRVWLFASIVATSLMPNVIIDYASSRALPRATRWLKPYFAGLPHHEEFLC